MNIQMNWKQLTENYPNEWVALIKYKKNHFHHLSGIVITHNTNWKKFHKTVRKLLPRFGNIAIRFTGELIRNAEIPLLWQISPID